MKPARIFLTKGAAAVGQHQIVRHEDVAELHAVGAGAVHREERLAGLQRDGAVRTIGKEHHELAGCVLALEDRAEIMVRPEIGDPGQRAAHDIAAVDLAPFQFELLDPEKGLHRVRQAGAAENPPRGKAVAKTRRELQIGRIAGVPDQRVLAPRHEGGGAADLADRRHRLDGTTQIGRPLFREMAAPGADLAEAPEHLVRINGAAVDGSGERRQFVACDGRDLVGDRKHGTIDRLNA